MAGSTLRAIEAPFAPLKPSGVAIRTSGRNMSQRDREMLPLVGAHLGSLACADPKARCRAGTPAVLNERIAAQSEARVPLEAALREQTGGRIRPVA